MLAMYGQDKDWRFAVVGNTHVLQVYIIKKIIPSLIENKVEIIMSIGDLIQGRKGKNAQGMYEELTKPLRDAGIKMITI